ncbi:Ohr family peroxiredoxin [Kribbella sp. NPDC050459]|uniref:Ohr family peroxiredoxin n=1 Tax=Kribbella sp. NPDC050459 TaxID=3155785 RepID=UPI0033F72074
MNPTTVNPTYTAVATASGRDSRAVTADGQLDIQLAMPKEMGGTGDGLNPEQLFAAGWAACFSTVLGILAKRQNLDAKDVAVTAEVSLVPAGGRLDLAAVLRVELPDHLRGEVGDKLLEATHATCPYSRATHGNISVDVIAE